MNPAANHKFSVGQNVKTKGTQIFFSRMEKDSAFDWNYGVVEELGWSKPVKVLDMSPLTPEELANAYDENGRQRAIPSKYISVNYPMIKVNGKWFDERNVRKAK